MTNRITAVKKLSPYSWEFTLSGTAPFKIYYQGCLIDTAYSTTYSAVGEVSNVCPDIEVLDATETISESITNPPFMILSWYGSTTAAYYKIEKYIGSTWTEQKRIAEVGKGYYVYYTPFLSDRTSENWRVTAYDLNDAASIAITSSSYIIRNPNAPSVNITYSSNLITVSAS